jgi:hypothetical protein
VVGVSLPALYLRAGDEAQIIIYRKQAGGVEQVLVTSDAAVGPDDVVSVNLRPARLIGMAATCIDNR